MASVLNQLSLPKHISEEYNAFQLVKICKNHKYLNDFIQGKLYMSTIKNISNIERKELTEGQADRFEGTEQYWQKNEDNYMAMNFANEEYTFEYFNEEPIDKENLVEIFNVELGRHKNRFKNIFCMYSMWFDTLNKKVLDVSHKVIDNFGDYAAIIINPTQFIERFNTAINNYSQVYNKRYNTDPTLGFVDYVNFEDKGIIQLGIYRKANTFIYQNEFRICLDIKGNEQDLCYFEIGDLSDIVVEVKTNDLVNNARIEGDYLVVGDAKIDFGFSNY